MIGQTDTIAGVTRRGVLAGKAASAAATALPAWGTPVPAPRSALATLPVSLTVNMRQVDLTVDTRTTLRDALREHLKLTGTKKGCDPVNHDLASYAVPPHADIPLKDVIFLFTSATSPRR